MIANWAGIGVGSVIAFEGYRTIRYPEIMVERRKLGAITPRTLRQFGFVLIFWGAIMALGNALSLVKG